MCQQDSFETLEAGNVKKRAEGFKASRHLRHFNHIMPLHQPLESFGIHWTHVSTVTLPNPGPGPPPWMRSKAGLLAEELLSFAEAHVLLRRRPGRPDELLHGLAPWADELHRVWTGQLVGG